MSHDLGQYRRRLIAGVSQSSAAVHRCILMRELHVSSGSVVWTLGQNVDDVTPSKYRYMRLHNDDTCCIIK